MIQEFLISQFANVKRVLIDPEATNKRAIYVYQKVGFKIIGGFYCKLASSSSLPNGAIYERSFFGDKEMNKDVQVDLNEIINAFEMITMTGDDFSRSFMNMYTGRIVTLFKDEDFSDVEDEDLEGDWIPDHYASLPEKDELNEYEMMERFCCAITNRKIQEDLLHAIQGKGAFGRFKTAIRCHNVENKWHKFREECLKEIAIEFCEHYGLRYHYSSRCGDH